ncbi:MAG: competence protein ComEA [Gaiellales bacterium]|jgi:competence protein ComEA|nr:competence protein ComEA [Gaiellales bacterium]
MLPISPQRLALYVVTALAVVLIGWKMQGGGSSPSSSLPPPAAMGAEPVGAEESPVVVVDVVGAVRRPGVYRLPNGSRVMDAIKRARPVRGAQLAALNMAARLADGEQIVVPKAGQAGVAPTAGVMPGGGSEIVHLNSATIEQLDTLDGIGPSLAQAIIDYRTEHGGFRSLEELDQVSGIGPARLAALRDHVAL